MPQLPDIEPSLVKRVRQNDEEAIAQIYEKLNKKAYVSAYYILGADERFKNIISRNNHTRYVSKRIQKNRSFKG